MVTLKGNPLLPSSPLNSPLLPSLPPFNFAQSNAEHPGCRATFCRFLRYGLGLVVVVVGVGREAGLLEEEEEEAGRERVGFGGERVFEDEVEDERE